MSGYREMTSQGSYNQATRPMTKQERADRSAAEERESQQRRLNAMAWVREKAPWLPDGWVGVYAGFAMHLKYRDGKAPTIDQITEFLRPTWPIDDPEIGIKPTKEKAT